MTCHTFVGIHSADFVDAAESETRGEVPAQKTCMIRVSRVAAQKARMIRMARVAANSSESWLSVGSQGVG